MSETTVNNNSDIGITCGKCGAVFSSAGDFAHQLLEMFIKHYEELH